MKRIVPRNIRAAIQEEIPAVSLLDRRPGHAFLSPKRPSEDSAGLADVFPYYAGFSFEWACVLLSTHEHPESAVVLDPWNGSGTTTLAAQHVGLRSIGVDRNPVANVVAGLRSGALVKSPTVIEPGEVAQPLPCANEDALFAWFTPDSTARIRAWADSLTNIADGDASLALVALFRAVRNLTARFEGSNPTWVRRAKNEGELVSISAKEFDSLIMKHQADLLERIKRESQRDLAPVQLLTASSSSLPVASDSVGIVLTSPPYLTRIDYAVAYTRELALLGFDISSDRTIRSALMGTTLIRADGSEAPFVGSAAARLLENISDHSSKASSGYYRKQANQYLRDLVAGLDEITRVTHSGASLHLVVQEVYS